MTERPTALVRALALAGSGEVTNLTELRTRMKREHYGNEADKIWGKHLKMQLRRLIVAARDVPAANLVPDAAGMQEE